FLRPTDGGEAIRVGDGEALEISADGKRALINTSKSPLTFALVPTGAGSAQTLSLPGREIRAVHFLPASDELLFATPTAGGPLESLAAKPGAPGGGHLSTGDLWLGPISPDGKCAVIESQEGGAQLLDLDGSGARRPLSGFDGDLDLPLGFSRDGKALFLER